MNPFFFLLPLLVCVLQSEAQVYDVTNYGPLNRNTLDITTPLQRAWAAACASPTPSAVRIPLGTYALREIKLFGPCNSSVAIELKGIVTAPAHPAEMQHEEAWVSINNVDRFTLYGGGTFDGRGRVTWSLRRHGMPMKIVPISIKFNRVSNSVVKEVTSLDSKHFHMGLLGCTNMTFERVTIIAPADSPNTDGIHLGLSSSIIIRDSVIRTGDDCISIGHGSSHINIRGITCGPGHGISVGSLGGHPDEEPVVDISVINCTFLSSENGVRIKTWPFPNYGLVTDLHFEDLVVDNVWFPILIDQYYCPQNDCNNQDSGVQITGVRIKNVRGTATRSSVVTMKCSRSSCKNVELRDIDLVYNGPGSTTSNCSNVNPVVLGVQNPVICDTNVGEPILKTDVLPQAHDPRDDHPQVVITNASPQAHPREDPQVVKTDASLQAHPRDDPQVVKTDGLPQAHDPQVVKTDALPQAHDPRDDPQVVKTDALPQAHDPRDDPQVVKTDALPQAHDPRDDPQVVKTDGSLQAHDPRDDAQVVKTDGSPQAHDPRDDTQVVKSDGSPQAHDPRDDPQVVNIDYSAQAARLEDESEVVQTII